MPRGGFRSRSPAVMRPRLPPEDVIRIQTTIPIKQLFVLWRKLLTISGFIEGNSGEPLSCPTNIPLAYPVAMRASVRQIQEDRTRRPTGLPRFTVSAFRLSGRGVF